MEQQDEVRAQNSSAAAVTYGEPFVLYTHDNPDNVHDVQLPGATLFHSHFWTNWFADLNFGAVETAEQSPAFLALTEDAKMWIDAGVDGFRLDAVKHIYHNENSNENPLFLKKFYDYLNAYYKQTRSGDIYMVGEVFSDYQHVAPYYGGLPALFEFSFWHRLQWALDQHTGCYFAKDNITFEDTYKPVRGDYIRATKLSNHDEVRTRTQLNQSLAKTKLAAAVLLTSGRFPLRVLRRRIGVHRQQNARRRIRQKSHVVGRSVYDYVYRQDRPSALPYGGYRTGASSRHGFLVDAVPHLCQGTQYVPGFGYGKHYGTSCLQFQRPIFVAAHWGVVSYGRQPNVVGTPQFWKRSDRVCCGRCY